MKRKVFLSLPLFLPVLLPQLLSAADSPVAAVTGIARQTVTVQQQTQKAVAVWEKERQEMLARLQNGRIEEDLLRFRQKKLRRYLAERRGRIAKLKQGIVERQVITRELEPFLDQTHVRAKGMFQQGLPFLEEERQQRFAGLDATLNSYDATLAEKLRRVLEMLQIEARYGHQVEAYDRVLTLAGKETTVNVLRLGRIGLYYLTLDGREAGWYNPELKSWETLPRRFLEPVKDGLRMAMKQRAVDLVRLPVGKGGWQ
jgi:hypothetical protein